MHPSLTSLALCIVFTAGSLCAQSKKLDSNIQDDSTTIEVFVRMEDQLFKTGADYPAFCKKNSQAKRSELRKQVIATLKKKSDASFAKIEKLLKQHDDDVEGLQRYWIVNGFACRATGDLCHLLAAQKSVGFVYRMPRGIPKQSKRVAPKNPRIKRLTKASAKKALAQIEAAKDEQFPALDKLSPTWNLKRIKAPEAWKDGYFGQGVTIGLIDSGLAATPALSRALWQNPGEKLNGKDDDGNGFVDDLFGYDFQFQQGLSVGDFNVRMTHGTMCGGIMAARPVEVDGKLMITGIAPKAKLMVLRGMGLIRAYEYALDNGADVISMSFMFFRAKRGNWRGVFRLAHEHMTAAGIVSVGGSGNFRNLPKGRQIAIPKDIPCVICASGLGKDNKLPGFSSLGPCTWDGVKFYDDYPAEQPLSKPDVTAFSKDFPCWAIQRGRLRRGRVVKSFADNVVLWVGAQGNSFAGPHAGGVAALMLSANPDLPAWRVKELMESTCKDLGKKGRDVRFGEGMMNAQAAARAARDARGATKKPGVRKAIR